MSRSADTAMPVWGPCAHGGAEGRAVRSAGGRVGDFTCGWRAAAALVLLAAVATRCAAGVAPAHHFNADMPYALGADPVLALGSFGFDPGGSISVVLTAQLGTPAGDAAAFVQNRRVLRPAGVPQG